jgi:voltage-gated potassium channel
VVGAPRAQTPRLGTPAQRVLWDALDGDPSTASQARWVEVVLQGLIALNVVAVVLETVPGVGGALAPWWRPFEVLSVLVFSVEYLARLWSAPAAAPGRTAAQARWDYVRSPLALIDLAALAPFYLGGAGLDLRVLRAVRVFRLLRVAKLARYVGALRVVSRVLRAKQEQLAVVGAGLVLLLILSASLIYFAEHDAQADKFGSIPEAMWWAVATLTTIGYGDIYPITVLGKVLAAVISVCGIAFFALPAGILGAGFLEAFQGAPVGPGSATAPGEAPGSEALPAACPACGCRCGSGAGASPRA